MNCDSLTHRPGLRRRNQLDRGAVLSLIKTPEYLPDDVATLKAALIETRAKQSGTEPLIAHLQPVIEKMKRETFGPRSERSQRLLDQMELQLEELAARRVRISPELPITRTQNPLSLPWRWKLTDPPPAAKAA